MAVSASAVLSPSSTLIEQPSTVTIVVSTTGAADSITGFQPVFAVSGVVSGFPTGAQGGLAPNIDFPLALPASGSVNIVYTVMGHAPGNYAVGGQVITAATTVTVTNVALVVSGITQLPSED